VGKSLNELVREMDNEGTKDEGYTFDKLSQDLEITKVDINDDDSVKSFANALLKEANSETNYIPQISEKPFQLNPIEKVAEFVMIANLLRKKFSTEV